MESKNTSEVYNIELRNLESLLKKKLGSDIKVVDYDSKPLLSMGENYGSTLLKVDATIKKKDDAHEEKLHLVAKMLPATEFQRNFFDSPVSFQKEIFLYEELIPSYQKLEREFGVEENEVFNIVPEFFGARFSLTHSEAIDEDAVILMQNLKAHEYYTVDRREGLNFQHAKAALSALAHFHGLGVAMKTHKPADFEVIRNRAKCLEFDEDDDVDYFDDLLKIIREDPEMSKHYERLELALSQNWEKLNTDIPPEPWITIVHNDFWINNFLFRKVNNEITDVKFVDFQNYLCLSPLRDLTFFLFANLHITVMENHFDDLIDHYYENFIRVLQKMKCDIQRFQRDKFDKRLKIDAFEELLHIPYMIRIMTLDVKHEKLHNIEKVMTDVSVNSLFLEKLKSCVKKYVEKGWLYN